MKTSYNIFLMALCGMLALPASGQVTKSNKSKTNQKSNYQIEQNEILSEFEQEYKLSCNLKLDRARTLFEKGLLERIPYLLNDCACNNDLSDNTQVEVLKLLAETHLFLNEEKKAADHYESLLNINPFYQVHEQIDHPELVHLAKQFKTYAFFSYGISVGAQQTLVQSKKQFRNEAVAANLQDHFTGEWNSSIAAFLNYRPRTGKIELGVELNYSSIRYNYLGDMVPVSGLGSSRLVFSERDRIWQIPVTAKYHLFRSELLKPYIYIGVGPTFTTRARMEDLKRTLEENGNFSQAASTGITISSGADVPLRKLVNASGCLGVGIRYHKKRYSVFADLRYNKMLTNAVVTDNRFKNEKLKDELWHVDNDLSFDSFGLSVGIGYSIFKTIRKR